MSRTRSGVSSTFAATSSTVGSRPSSWSIWRCTRSTLFIVSTMCTGMRIVRAWSAMAAGDGLADPPRGVGGELEALRVVELLDRTDQAEVALLHEVEQRHAATDVALGDRHDEPEVRFGELPLGHLAVGDDGLEARALLVAEIGCRSRAARCACTPASMRCASVTSCSPVSSGTLPISLRYIRTGSKLAPSLRSRPRAAYGVPASRRQRTRGRRRQQWGAGAAAALTGVRVVGDSLGRVRDRATCVFAAASSSVISSTTSMPRSRRSVVDRGELRGLGLEIGNAAKISPVVTGPSVTPREQLVDVVSTVGGSARRGDLRSCSSSSHGVGASSESTATHPSNCIAFCRTASQSPAARLSASASSSTFRSLARGSSARTYFASTRSAAGTTAFTIRPRGNRLGLVVDDRSSTASRSSRVATSPSLAASASWMSSTPRDALERARGPRDR